jgi:hypothetical protein
VVDLRVSTICLLLLVGCAWDASGGQIWHDPLRPSHYSAAATRAATAGLAEPMEPVWQLSAVLFSDARLVAVLNGQRVQVGDVLQGFRIRSIERDRVTLHHQERTIVVLRAGAGLKKPAGAEGENGKKGRIQ